MTTQEIEALQIGDVILYKINKKEKIQYIVLYINTIGNYITLKRTPDKISFKFNYNYNLLNNTMWQLKSAEPHPIVVLMSLLEENK